MSIKKTSCTEWYLLTICIIVPAILAAAYPEMRSMVQPAIRQEMPVNPQTLPVVNSAVIRPNPLIFPMIETVATANPPGSDLQSATYTNEANTRTPETQSKFPACKFTLHESSKRFWSGTINSQDPDVIEFNILLNHNYTTGHNALNPLHWVWVSSRGDEEVPFLHWPLDYGILSFHLLETKVVTVDYVILSPRNHTDNGTDRCTIELGDNSTTQNIVQALIGLVNETDSGKPSYDTHTFCYMQYIQPEKDSISYIAALYANFPSTLASKNYKCCKVKFNYTIGKYEDDCFHIVERWDLCIFGPYIMALVMFMCFPIPLYEMCAWLAKEVTLNYQQYVQLTEQYENSQDLQQSARLSEEWLLMDGKPPLTFLDTFGYLTAGFRQRHPVCMSRLVRLVTLLLIPLTLLFELYQYSQGLRKNVITIRDLMKIGNPNGFLTLKGDYGDMAPNFAPIFGGPLGILCMYFVLGLLLTVVPQSLKQVIENGMPKTRKVSPLFLSPADISELSGINIHADAGYQKAAAVYRCSIYMLFSGKFWSKVLAIQKDRFVGICESEHVKIVKLCAVVGLCVVCLVEIILCVLLYGLPICGCLMITMKGGMVSIANLRIPNRRIRRMLRSTCGRIFLSVGVLITLIGFIYAIGLIFLENFLFISKIVLFCTVAVFTYPSVSFGYLFFYVVLVVYIVRLIREFGELYLELLNRAVDISIHLEASMNRVSIKQGGHVYIDNLQTLGIGSIHINGIDLQTPSDILQTIGRGNQQRKVIMRDDVYAIPRDLFDLLVTKHRPIHVHLLKLATKLICVIVFVGTALNITSREVMIPTSDISEVLHVLFIVAMGMIPHMLEVVFPDESKVVESEILMRKMTRTVSEYWQHRSQPIQNTPMSRVYSYNQEEGLNTIQSDQSQISELA